MSRLVPLTLALSLALVPAACALTGEEPASSTPDVPTLTATWEPSADAPFPGSLTGEVRVPASDEAMVDITLQNARFTALPAACTPSTIVRPRSRILAGHERLRCELPESEAERTVEFAAVAVGATGDEMSGTVRVDQGDDGEPGEVELPALGVSDAPESLSPRLRLVSSPDFLNADVGDLAKGPGFWDPSRSANGINAEYRAALDAVLADWQATEPDGVLVAGDLVDGRWGGDTHGTGNFGPVGTPAERTRALGLAADTYYPQWLERFRQFGLEAFPAAGDHEYGDNPWPADKRALAPAFRERFADYFTRTPDGRPRFADRPTGPHEFTAYAGRPLPDVQVISLDWFDITADRARIGLDAEQRRWLRGVLRRAERDGVRWTIVQGHVPILGPVRTRGSSKLQLAGGADSQVWRMFEQYGVDLYLAGEAHDVTVLEEGGVTQVVHGGLFQFGLTNALLLDFYDDFVYLTLRDYVIRHREADDGTRLWETRRSGMPRHIEVRRPPLTLGTGVLPDAGGLEQESGVLVPGYDPAP